MDFNYISDVQKEVNDGRLMGGPLEMENEGKGILLDFDTQEINGNSYFVFWLTRPGAVGYRKCQIRIPKPTDKDAAKYMGFQRISKTVFGVVKANAKTDRIDQVIEKIRKIMQTHSIDLLYKGQKSSFINQRTGKETASWELDELIGIGPIAKIPFGRPAPVSYENNPQFSAAYMASDSDVPF